MPILLKAPDRSCLLDVRPLRQEYFHPFGNVISNPDPTLWPSKSLTRLPANATLANQGSAIKYLNVSSMLDLYTTSSGKNPSVPIINMFVCAPRELLPAAEAEGVFKVEILERHPFTTQTFIPLGISAAEQDQARYLVIVASSLAPSEADESLPVPSPTVNTPSMLPGRGLPDLSNVHAFIATGNQAVTYGAGTWHAPMVALGNKPIDFVVVQFANGVPLEDCQEAIWEGEHGSGLQVVIRKAQKASKL